MKAFFVIPGDLGAASGGYRYDREILARAAAQGVDLTHLPLTGEWPAPTAADMAEAARCVAETPADSLLLIDGLAFGTMPEKLVAGFNRRIVALVHHPLALETGLDPARATELAERERAALTHAREIVVTSAFTADLVRRDFAPPGARINVVEPGTARAPRAQGGGDPVRLLAVGSLVPRKDYPVLIAALSRLTALRWTLDIAGSETASPDTALAVRADIRAKGLADRVRLHGAVGDAALDELYARTDLFVMSSRFEGYGMALAEALARGIPIVTTRAGAAADTVPDDAALKVEPGDVEGLARVIARLVEDVGLRRKLSDASWRAGQSLPTWDYAVVRVAAVLRRVHDERQA